MARFQRGLRIKHVVDFQTAVPLNTKIATVLARADDFPALDTPIECGIGSIINGFYLTVEAVASETDLAATPNFYLIIYKNPGGNLTFPNGNNVGADDNKKYVIHQEMVMINNNSGGTPRNIFKGVIKMPSLYKRMGPNDQIEIQFFIPSTGITVNACGQCHYKEFR